MSSKKENRKDFSDLYKYYEITYGKNTEDVDQNIPKLPEKDQDIFHKKFGKDIKNPVLHSLSSVENSYFQNAVRHLTNLLLYDSIKRPKGSKPPEEFEISEKENDSIEQIKDSKELTVTGISKQDCMSIEDANTIISVFNKPEFKRLHKNMSMNEIAILSLCMNYTTSEISENFGISNQDVIDITKSSLIKLKKNFCTTIDEVVKIKEKGK